MSSIPPERPQAESAAWPSTSANSFRQQYIAHSSTTDSDLIEAAHAHEQLHSYQNMRRNEFLATSSQIEGTSYASGDKTAVPSASGSQRSDTDNPSNDTVNVSSGIVPNEATPTKGLPTPGHPTATTPSAEEVVEADDEYTDGKFQPIKTAATKDTTDQRPKMQKKASGPLAHEHLFRALSRRKTNTSDRQGSQLTPAVTQEEQAEIERLMSRMFGQNRREQSEEEKTRHVGLIFKNLTVKGVGLGAALQPTLSDPFLGLPRLLTKLFSRGKSATGKSPVRTILNDFTGCVRPGEMLLVLGRPGAGCSTFLKVLANQRFGYESVQGDVTYGGSDTKEMEKNYRGEIVYNPEDDLHYATLSVKNTLSFALKTRTPGKESRNEGESRADYVREFLRVVAKLFWIEHTLSTKVGNEFVRGVSGGEKKRVSIAEAMITRASTQCWDNSTRGLDASTALEYVESLRTLTNMAHISTLVALYQAGESLYECFDKVILIHEVDACTMGLQRTLRRISKALVLKDRPAGPPPISSRRLRILMSVKSGKALKTVYQDLQSSSKMHTARVRLLDLPSKMPRILSRSLKFSDEKDLRIDRRLQSRRIITYLFISRRSNALTDSSSSCLEINSPSVGSGEEFCSRR